MVGRPEIDVEAVRTAADAHHRAAGTWGQSVLAIPSDAFSTPHSTKY